jgi:hypothetical protein
MNRIFTFITIFVFIAILLFSIGLNVNAQNSAETIVGEVTSIDHGTINIKEDSTQEEYELRASSSQLRNVQTGYRVEVKTANGRVLSLTVLGMPTQSQITSSQRFKVIKHGDQTIKLKVEGTEEKSTFNKPNETAVAAIPNLSGTVIGEVTSVDHGTINIKEDSSQTEYELRASSDILKDVIPGYRIEAKAINGRVSSLTILGMPMQAQPEPSQKVKGTMK